MRNHDMASDTLSDNVNTNRIQVISLVLLLRFQGRQE